MRYLLPEQLRANLSLGKPVEQWLPPWQHDDYVVLRRVGIHKEKSTRYTTSCVECFDDGDVNFIDIYEFSPLQPGEPEVLTSFDSVDESLQFVIKTYDASAEKFMTAGMIQEGYKTYLASR